MPPAFLSSPGQGQGRDGLHCCSDQEGGHFKAGTWGQGKLGFSESTASAHTHQRQFLLLLLAPCSPPGIHSGPPLLNEPRPAAASTHGHEPGPPAVTCPWSKCPKSSAEPTAASGSSACSPGLVPVSTPTQNSPGIPE